MRAGKSHLINGLLWSAHLPQDDSRQPHRPQTRRLLPSRPFVLRLLCRAAHDQPALRFAVRRRAAPTGRAADTAPHGPRRLGAGDHRRGHGAAGARRRRRHRTGPPVPGRRGRPQLRRQRRHPARRLLRSRVDTTRSRRCRWGARRRPQRLLSVPGSATLRRRSHRCDARLVPRPRLRPGRHRGPPLRRRGQVRSRRRGPAHRPECRGADGGQGAGLVPGPHGVRAVGPGCEIYSRRRPLRNHAVGAQPQD